MNILKTGNTFFIVFFVSRLLGMEAPLTPQKQQRIEAAVYTPQSKTVRLNLLNTVARAIDPHLGVYTADDMDDEFAYLSPKSFCKELRSVFVENMELKAAQMGVTPEMIAKKMPQARRLVTRAANARKKTAQKASSELMEDAAYIAERFPGATFEIQEDPSVSFIIAIGDKVFYNKEDVEKLADTPRKRRKALSHERMHGKYQDSAVRTSYAVAFEDQGKLQEYKESLEGPLYRTHEAFADLEPACESSSFADDGRRLWSHVVTIDGRGHAAKHPANIDRWLYMIRVQDLHERAELEEKRKRVMAGGAKVAQLLEAESITEQEKLEQESRKKQRMNRSQLFSL